MVRLPTPRLLEPLSDSLAETAWLRRLLDWQRQLRGGSRLAGALAFQHCCAGPRSRGYASRGHGAHCG